MATLPLPDPGPARVPPAPDREPDGLRGQGRDVRGDPSRLETKLGRESREEPHARVFCSHMLLWKRVVEDVRPRARRYRAQVPLAQAHLLDLL